MGLESELGKKALEAGRELDIEGVRAHVESLVSCVFGPHEIYEELLREIGDAQIVLIGEATHGSREFYEERANITKILIEEKVRYDASDCSILLGTAPLLEEFQSPGFRVSHSSP